MDTNDNKNVMQVNIGKIKHFSKKNISNVDMMDGERQVKTSMQTLMPITHSNKNIECHQNLQMSRNKLEL